MASPFVGEIRLVGFNFAARGWADCYGQLLPISQFTALFSLLGTAFGGDGRVTFALPDLRGRVPIGAGNGAGLTPRTIGEQGGVEFVSLVPGNIPAHTHMIGARREPGNAASVGGTLLASSPHGTKNFASQAPAPVPMAADMLAPAGQSLPHDNIQPTLTLKYIIALNGIFPARP